MVLHLLINLGLHRLHILVAKTPLCISLKWPSFYFKTFICSLFSLLVCSSEHQHSSVEMSDVTKNFFKSHFNTKRKKKKREKKKKILYSFSYLQSVLDLWYSCPWFLCLSFKWIHYVKSEYYACVDMYRSFYMLLKKRIKKLWQNTLSFHTENLTV